MGEPLSLVQSPVKEIYAAFANGDIEAILSNISDEVEWEYPGTSTSVPWLQHRSGRAGVMAFFQSLSEVEIQKFIPHTFLESSDLVVVLLDVEFIVRKTGACVTEIDEIHIWRFNKEGFVSRFKHGGDTHRNQLATIESK